MTESGAVRGGMALENPFTLKVGQVFTGFGVGCGIGIGVGQPLNLGAIPVLDQVMRVTSGATATFSGVGQHTNNFIRNMGLKSIQAGVGCGVGFGHGFGAGTQSFEDFLAFSNQMATTMDLDTPKPTGHIVIENVAGRSALTSIFATYPLKFIRPTKAVPSHIDAIWIYTVFYGGGIVSGDSVMYTMTVGDGCTAVLTTQASTKVYKSVEAKGCEQYFEAKVGSNALLAILPDPVTCFSTAKYSQRQVFYVASDSNLVLVDWLTSGRHKRGEIWDFKQYKSTNYIYLDGSQPLFLDSVLLEQGECLSVADRMQAYHVIGMLVIIGPKMEFTQNQIKARIREMNTELFGSRSYNPNPIFKKAKISDENKASNEVLLASCSTFGPMDTGLVVRIAASTTESVYNFLREHLASIGPFIGTSPYSTR